MDKSLILKKFIESAIKNGEAVEKGESKKANKEFDLLQKYYLQLKESESINILSPLLESNNKYVQLWSSYYLLSIETKRSEIILEELSQIRGLISITAKITLKEWKKGTLRFPGN
ncbi:hypothetical protein [Clostridium estertheticum]|uniref:hypothetical protein n=1 Tax=Clostridium estertheticum TaxID=238834 RepID=UPI001CF31CD8|nr:hypothetical protein [Clostridium estertheticum]MCB2362146.1 hypothetical protein [Clostridium estertheticum]